MKLESYKKKIAPKNSDVLLQREGAGDINTEPSTSKPKQRRVDSRPPQDNE